MLNLRESFSRSQSPDWERKRKQVEIHGSLSYKVNLAYIMNSKTGPIFSNQFRLRSQSGD